MNIVSKKGKKRPVRRQKDALICMTLTEVCPPQIEVPLSYSARLIFNGAVTVDNVFNLNSLFDPDRSGVGHQPLGFDQWSAFYNRYRVDKADVIVDFSNNAASSFNCLIEGNNDATAIGTLAQFDAAVESPYCSAASLGTLTGIPVKRLKRSFDLARVTGVTRAKYKNDDLYSATTGANPTEVITLHVAVQDPGFAINVQAYVRVQIKYHATFWDRNQLTQS
jgi:hypothetical protein